jgi:hypothetical protein
MAIRYNLWPFGTVCGHLLYFSQFGMFFIQYVWTKKNLATLELRQEGSYFIFFLRDKRFFSEPLKNGMLKSVLFSKLFAFELLH